MTYQEQMSEIARAWIADEITVKEKVARESHLRLLLENPNGHFPTCKKFGQAGDCNDCNDCPSVPK